MTEGRQREVFNDWLKQYKGLFFKVIQSYAFTSEDQDDLFQDILIQVWRSIPRFRGDSAVTTWLYRIAFNTALKWKSKERRHREGRQALEPGVHIFQERHANDQLVWLYEQIKQLDEIDRSLCLLLLDGFSYKDMSVILGISESNVAVKIHRIKKQLISRSRQTFQTNEL